MGLSEVSNILWRERQLLQLLLFKLDTEQLVLANGHTRFLADATREVELVINELREAEVLRAIAVASLAEELQLSEEPSLKEIVDAAPPPWDNIFEEHRKAFLNDTQEVAAMSQTNRDLLASGHKAARDALEWLSKNGAVEANEPQAEAYSAKGAAPTVSQSGAKLFDGVV